MKKTLMTLALVLVCGLVGCGSGNKQTSEGATTEAAEKKENVVRFSGDKIVDANYVKENIDSNDIVLVDARGEEAAAKGTVKGAVALAWQYLATCEDGKSGDENWGCILDTKRLSERLGEMGLAKDKEIILFAAAQDGWGDDGRIAWELLAAGYENVKMVDGGIAALEAAGVEMQKGGTKPVAVDVKIDNIDETNIINTTELVADYADYKVIDVRADEEYNGETLYGEVKGGHLPSAIHIRYTDLFNEDSTLKSNADITAMIEAAGITKEDKIVTYCTAGIRSGYMQLILDMCGFKNVKNYDESYYRWCAVEDVEK